MLLQNKYSERHWSSYFKESEKKSSNPIYSLSQGLSKATRRYSPRKFWHFFIYFQYFNYYKFLFMCVCVRVCVCVCVCVLCVCVCVRPFTKKAPSVQNSWNVRAQINEAVFKTILFSSKSIHRYFRMKQEAFLINPFILLTHQMWKSHDLAGVHLAFKS